MPRLDLDAARAARLETNREPKELVWGGEVFTLPVELPYDFAESLSSGEPKDALRVLLGADFERFWNAAPVSVNDVTALAEGIASDLYAVTLGEAPASPISSLNGSRQSRQTSPATTG